MLFIAIETSCDDTSVAVMDGPNLLAQASASQTVHADWGGVVPELASRAHQTAILPTLNRALAKAGKQLTDAEAIAYTQGPGLLGALLVGQSFAKGLSLSLDVPLLGVNHMKAHVLANFLEDRTPTFPFLCLTVSGGHTQLIKVISPEEMHLLGQTRDDAAGEAFDKCAKMLGLPYPGGPHIDRLAATGNPTAFPFPVADMPGLDYSFSGLKTAVRVFIQQKAPDFVQANLSDICASIQHTLVKTLLAKLTKAATETSCTQVALAGGVAANRGLRDGLSALAQTHGWQVFFPRLEFCTDNAAMIGITAHYAWQAGHRGSLADTLFVNEEAAPEGIGMKR